MDNNYELLKQQIENFISITKEQIKSLKDENKSLKDKIDILDKQSTKTDVQYSNIIETLNKLTTQVEDLKEKPAKRYDTMIGSILGAICGAVGGAIAGFFIK